MNGTRRDGTTSTLEQPARASIQTILPDEAGRICRILRPSGGRGMAKLNRDNPGVHGVKRPREGYVRILHAKEGCSVLVGFSEAKEECSRHDLGRIRRRIQSEVL